MTIWTKHLLTSLLLVALLIMSGCGNDASTQGSFNQQDATDANYYSHVVEAYSEIIKYVGLITEVIKLDVDHINPQRDEKFTTLFSNTLTRYDEMLNSPIPKASSEYEEELDKAYMAFINHQKQYSEILASYNADRTKTALTTATSHFARGEDIAYALNDILADRYNEKWFTDED